jgi:hypothetical protein
MDKLIEPLGPFAPLLLAFVVTLVLTPLAIRLARRVGAVDRPKAERWHDRETPLLGGTALTGGIVAAILAFGGFTSQTIAAVAGVLLLHVVGLVDDVKGVRPANKLIAQTVAAGILVLGGVRAGWPEDAILSVPLTVFWVLGITNALNLLDNMDGHVSFGHGCRRCQWRPDARGRIVDPHVPGHGRCQRLRNDSESGDDYSRGPFGCARRRNAHGWQWCDQWSTSHANHHRAMRDGRAMYGAHAALQRCPRSECVRGMRGRLALSGHCTSVRSHDLYVLVRAFRHGSLRRH